MAESGPVPSPGTALQAILALSTGVLASHIADDLEAEGDAFNATVANVSSGDDHYVSDPPAEESNITAISALRDNIKSASQGVVVPNTLKGYRRLWSDIVRSCTDRGFIKAESELVGSSLPADAPLWFAIHIASVMSLLPQINFPRCDEIDIETNKQRAVNEPRSTYGHAQKIRAAISHKYGQDLGLGAQPWRIEGDRTTGNPSMAPSLATYMVSLRQRKARSGEQVTSVRVITDEVIKKLFHFNKSFIDAEAAASTLTPASQKQPRPASWGDSNTRIMLHLLYVLSFWCLLRYDEALRIQCSGDIQPFFLYPRPDAPHICPLYAYTWWISVAPIMRGPLFPAIRAQGRRCDSHTLTQTRFLELFRHNLMDVGIDPQPYGTHSFRRGGCQYLHQRERWSIQDVCEWGGWTYSYDNPGSVFKYLISWSDDPSRTREMFLHPVPPIKDHCRTCKRTCNCH
ncbi:hypothetical protein BS47DRAFT_1369940 [Hydnum rufescens UP504]|uniref:Tyr recombinase domain-containing protein n=1 Tax=Hydnum rufescens UP504 TaxID=1448309 RepID=A0A9P6DLV2_9AGAM|nr:hypothetical protein BS47DRAFT_1369940 [Hydnum rufescens UP504]